MTSVNRNELQMSEEQLIAFEKEVRADAVLHEQVRAAADPDAVVEIAKAAGFLISAEDLQNTQAELKDVTGGSSRRVEERREEGKPVGWSRVAGW